MGDTESMQVARRCGSGWAPGLAPSQAFQICQTCQTGPRRLEFVKVGKAPRRVSGALLITARATKSPPALSYSFQIQGHITIETDTTSIARCMCPDWRWDACGTQGAVRRAWHFHQPLTRVSPATCDRAVRLQRHAALLGKLSWDTNDQRQDFCLLEMLVYVSWHCRSRPLCMGLPIATSETSRLRTSGTVNLGAGYMRGYVKRQDTRNNSSTKARRRSRFWFFP